MAVTIGTGYKIRRIWEPEGAVADHAVIAGNDPFFYTCHCGNNLESRARSPSFLGGFIVHRTGKIFLKMIKIVGVQIICQTVIVISGISNTSQSLPCPGICNNYRTGTWVQSKLCRRDLQVADLLDHKIIGPHRSGSQCIVSGVVLFQNPLVIQEHTQLGTGNNIGLKHVLVNDLGKSIIIT